MMDGSSRNSMSSSLRRQKTRPSHHNNKSFFKSVKHVGGFVILAWMIIAPLVWNVSKVFAPQATTTANDGEDNAIPRHQVMLDAPAVRDLKPVKKTSNKSRMMVISNNKKAMIKSPPSIRNQEAPPVVVKNTMKGVRSVKAKEMADTESKKPAPVRQVSKAVSKKMVSKKTTKNNLSPRKITSQMANNTKIQQMQNMQMSMVTSNKMISEQHKKNNTKIKQPKTINHDRNASKATPQKKKTPEKLKATNITVSRSKPTMLINNTTERLAPVQNISSKVVPENDTSKQHTTTKIKPSKAAPLSQNSDIPYAQVWDTLKAVIGVLTASNVDYFLIAGSLLGFSRSNDTQNPWLDTDIDLAVSTSWLKLPGNVESLHHNLTSAGFLSSQNYKGVDGTPLTLGGSQCYTRHNVSVELVATEVSPNFYINGFRHEHYRLGCPKPFDKVEEMAWGNSSLSVRVPTPVHTVLQATYGKEYNRRRVSQEEYESSRMDEVLSTGRCMVVKNLKQKIKKKGTHDFQHGIVTVVSKEESIAHALVLANHLNDWATRREHSQPVVALEVHHSGELSYYLEAKLTLHPFVTVVDLRTLSNFRSKKLNYTEANINMQALHFTKLKHVLWVNPHIQFLYDPLYVLQTAEYIHSQDLECKALPEGGSCVTATDPVQTELLDLAQHDSEHMHITRTLPARFMPKVFLNQTSLIVATLHEAIDGVGLWMHPTSNFSRWATTDILESSASFVMGKRHQPPKIASEYHSALNLYWRYFLEARRILLLDRMIEWVAHEGGFYWQHASLNSVKATHESHAVHAPIVNIGLTMSKDNHTFAAHNERQFTPFEFPGNKLPNLISSMKEDKLKNLTIPCLPEATARTWLEDNPYVEYNCSGAGKLKGHEEFLLYSLDAEVSYDLKASSGGKQIEVAKALAYSFQEWDEAPLDHGLVSVRFFDVMSSLEVTSGIIPDHALKALSSDQSLRRLSYYVTVPSPLACSQLLSWIANSNSFLNKKFLGCYVELKDTAIAKKWESFVESNTVPLDVLGMPTSPIKAKFRKFPEAKAICDISRKQTSPNRTFWKTSHIACIEEGFFYIMHPWNIPMNADFSPLPSGTEAAFPRIQNRMMKTIVPSQLNETMNSTDPAWSEYLSHWGLTHLSDWSNRRDDWFRGNSGIKKPPEANQTVEFQFATKALVSMLFLRLEELGFASLDDAVLVESPKTSSTSTLVLSWRHVLANTARQDGGLPGSRFDYNNEVWKHAPVFIERVCGMNFTTAMYHYVLEPSGMEGTFDLNPQHQYASRGFVGPFDDLLLLGGIFVNQGVSPKTRKQVLTASSIERMLSNTVLEYDPSRGQFYKHKVVQNLDRFWKSRKLEYKTHPSDHAVDGYGLGLWCVSGWRRTKQGDPIRGWLSHGSGEVLLYFDVTGMVMTFHSPTPHKGYDLRAAFANSVRDVGDHILDTVIPKF